jgi:hypothetical protein
MKENRNHRLRSRSNRSNESSRNNKPRSQDAVTADPTCKDEVALIADYLAGSLAPTVLVAFEEHLGLCRDCAGFLNTYKKTIEVTKSVLTIQSREIGLKPLRLSPRML